MKILKSISFLILINLITINLFASSDSLYKNQLKFTPLKMLHIYSGVEFSYQRNYSNLATEISFTRIMNFFNTVDSISTPSNKGYKIQLEQKFFSSPSKFKSIYSKPYYAINASYSQLRGKEGISVFSPYEGHSIADVRRDFFCLNGIIGWDIHYKHLILDVYFGLGVKHEIITYPNLPDHTTPYSELIFLQVDPGYYWLPNILGNLKIGYAF
jgi:hypothetical protein